MDEEKLAATLAQALQEAPKKTNGSPVQTIILIAAAFVAGGGGGAILGRTDPFYGSQGVALERRIAAIEQQADERERRCTDLERTVESLPPVPFKQRVDLLDERVNVIADRQSLANERLRVLEEDEE